MTSFYGFLHVVYEWYRAAVYIAILYGLISLIIHLKKGDESLGKSLSVIFTTLSIHFAINFAPSLMYILAPESIVLIVFVLLVFLGYNVLFLGYLKNWVNYLKKRRKTAPNPLWISVFIIGFSLFLIFHYFYMQYGGTYGVKAIQPQFLINTPFIKIALMLLLQVALLFTISVMQSAGKIKKTLQIISTILAGFSFATISVMVIIESSIPHYRFSTFENEPGTQIQIQISNGDSVITPIAFINGDEIPETEPGNLDDYLISNDFDPSTNLNDIPTIETNLVMTLSMAKGTLLSDVNVYDISKNLITKTRRWYELDKLDAGTYYVVAQIMIIDDPSILYGDYFFILKVK